MKNPPFPHLPPTCKHSPSDPDLPLPNLLNQNPNLSNPSSLMESDDDYQSFSLVNDEPSPSPKHRRLKRLKKSTDTKQTPTVKSVSELLGLPRVDFARLEALESSDVRGFDDSSEPFSSQSSPLPSKGFDDGQDKELSCGYGDGDEKGLSSGFDDLGVSNDRKETKRVLEFGDEPSEGFDDGQDKELAGSGDGSGKEPSSGFDDLRVSNDRKETKRALEFGDEMEGNEVEGETVGLKVKEDEKVEVNEGEICEKKEKKKRKVKDSDSGVKSKASSSNKKREEKERRAHLQQLHAESQRLLRETRGAAFKPVPLVQKPISSVLEKIRRRKLEVSKIFFQSNSNDLAEESNGCLREVVTNHFRNITIEKTEVSEFSGSAELEKASCVQDVEPGSDASCMARLDFCGEKSNHDNVPSEMALNEEHTPAFRCPIDDTQDLFGDSQTSDSNGSKEELPCDRNDSPQEEEMAPSTLTMKLKFDSAPDDISDEEEDNDKENVDPRAHISAGESSSPKGDPVKAFVDDEAEEEDDSDNDLMRFGENEEDEDNGDSEELADMIVSGYKERPVDNEARNELHQKWLEEKDAAGTDDLLRRLNVTSRLREASLLDEDEGEEDVELSNDIDDIDEAVERPRVTRIDSRKTKELIAQMFSDKDEAFLSSDDEETEKQLVKRCLLDKAEGKAKLVSPVEDESSREVFGLIKKLNIVPETRKKAKPTSFVDTMLTGGNSNSSSKSSFLSRVSKHSVPTSRKQGSTVRSFIFGRDDSNSRSSMSLSEDSSDTTSRENQTKKAKFSCSQTRSSTQTTKIVAEPAGGSGSTLLFEILKQSSVQSQDSVIDLSQSVFAAFKIPKKPMKIQGKV